MKKTMMGSGGMMGEGMLWGMEAAGIIGLVVLVLLVAALVKYIFFR